MKPNLKMQKSVSDLKYQLVNAPNVLDRIWASQQLSKKKSSSSVFGEGGLNFRVRLSFLESVEYPP